MWWYGRGNSGGAWLPEEKKAIMWLGRGNSGGSWPPTFPRSLCSPSPFNVATQFINLYNVHSVDFSLRLRMLSLQIIIIDFRKKQLKKFSTI